MAEKITQRKEYRGLGYAPAISVPGLVQTRPIAATRPPQTNELTKLAKSLKDFGESFANTQLRKAAREDQEAEQLAKEVASGLSLEDSFLSETGGASYGSKGDRGDLNLPSAASSVLRGNTEEMQQLVDMGVIPATATPAFHSYLKREMAKVIISTDFRNSVFRRIEESAVVSDQIDNEALRRDILADESERLESKYGKQFWIWAPDENQKVKAEFIQRSQALHNERLDEVSAESFKSNFGTIVDRWLDSRPKWTEEKGNKEQLTNQFIDQINQQVELVRSLGLNYRELSGPAAVSAIKKLLSEEQIEEAEMLFEELEDMSVGTSSDQRGDLPLLATDDEAVIKELIKNAKRMSETMYAKRKHRLDAVIQRKYVDFLAENPEAEQEDIRQFIARVYEEQVPLLNETNEDGSPKTLSPKQFDPYTYSEASLLNNWYEFKLGSALIKGQGDDLKKEINRLLQNPVATTEEGVTNLEIAQERLKENENRISSSTYSILSSEIFKASAYPEISGNNKLYEMERLNADALEKIAILGAGVEGEIDLNDISPGSEQEKEITRLKAEFRGKVTELAVQIHKDWLGVNEELATKDALARKTAAEKAIIEASKKVMVDLSAPDQKETLKKQWQDRELERQAAAETSWYSPDSTAIDLLQKEQEIRKKSRIALKSLTDAVPDKNLTVFEQLAVAEQRYEKNVSGNFRNALKVIQDENQAVTREARSQANQILKKLSSGNKYPGADVRNALPFLSKKLDDDDRAELETSLNQLVPLMGLSLREVREGKLYVKDLDANSQVVRINKGFVPVPLKAVPNPSSVPMFEHTAELLYEAELHDKNLAKGEPSQIDLALEKMGLFKKGMDDKEKIVVRETFVQAQLSILRERGMIVDYVDYSNRRERNKNIFERHQREKLEEFQRKFLSPVDPLNKEN